MWFLQKGWQEWFIWLLRPTMSGLPTGICGAGGETEKLDWMRLTTKKGEIGKVFKWRGKCSPPRLGERETGCLTGRTKGSRYGCRGNWMTASLWTPARGACCLLSLTTGWQLFLFHLTKHFMVHSQTPRPAQWPDRYTNNSSGTQMSQNLMFSNIY